MNINTHSYALFAGAISQELREIYATSQGVKKFTRTFVPCPPFPTKATH
jgi:hypothetical protein